MHKGALGLCTAPRTYTDRDVLDNWMHIAGLRPGRTEGEAELIGNLGLVGSRGRFCAIITERQLTLERFDGYGIRMDLESISKMRHMKIPDLPGGIPIIGTLAIGVGYSTLLPPVGWAVCVAGGISILSYLSLRSSVLVIENGAERHMVSGSEGLLMRLCLILERVRRGDSVIEARVGLEDIEAELPVFPSYMDAGGIAPPVRAALPMPPPPPIMEGVPVSRIDAEIESQLSPPPGNEEVGSWRSFHNDEAPTPEITDFPMDSESNLSAYERAWGRQESPDWYREKEPVNPTESRIESALSGAADMFGFGGIFDDEGVSGEKEGASEPESVFGSFFDEPNEPVSRVSSSSEMIKAAHNRFGEPASPFSVRSLPEPTVDAVREECKPGLVKMAKARQAQSRKALAAPIIDNSSLEDYPGVSKMVTSMSGGRVDTRGIARTRGKPGWIASLLRPKSKEVSKNSESYSSQYGDVDANEHGKGERFRTSQYLRLRSDQDHQADVVGRAKERSLPAPSSAKEALDRRVKKVLGGSEEIAPTLPAPDSGLRFSQLRRSSPKGEQHHIPGVRRLE